MAPGTTRTQEYTELPEGSMVHMAELDSAQGTTPAQERTRAARLRMVHTERAAQRRPLIHARARTRPRVRVQGFTEVGALLTFNGATTGPAQNASRIETQETLRE